MLCLLAAGVVGCTEVTLVELGQEGEECRNSDECDVGLLCEGAVCVPESGDFTTTGRIGGGGLPDADAGDDDASGSDAGDTQVGADATVNVVSDAGPDGGGVDLDVLPDVPLDGVAADVAPEAIEDVAPEVIEEDVPPEVIEEDVPPEVTEEDVVPDAGPDLVDVEVIGDVDPDPGVPGLGDSCEATCETGLVCMPQANGKSACAPFPDGLCLPCESDGDCPGAGAQCLTFPDGLGYCGSACGSNPDCPDDFFCTAGQCQPSTLSCICTADLLGFTLGCINQTPDGACDGHITCQIGGWSKCSASPPTEEICDGVDNDCDGVIDEAPFYIEEGKLLPFGSLCGIGKCSDGEVICAPDGTAVCSTNVFATPEACADNVDNDCDGAINEGCESTDFDGDGADNDVDCRPTDSAYFPGANEPCCPPSFGDSADCDLNCDGKVSTCAACDGDFDGVCPPSDCNDADPKVFPGAPDKCNDGVDQDCIGGDLPCTGAQDSDNDGYVPPADCAEGNPAVYPWAPELCDNLDNDCDGLTDEGNAQAGQLCGTTAEYCQSGLMVCTHYGYGAAIQCQGAIVEGPEKCDGIDNNCNGLTDEVWPDLGAACDGPDVDSCNNGVLGCLPSGAGTLCGDEALTNLIEACNDVDDDCDGATDEFVCLLDDLDGDGWTEAEGDCDDFRAEVHPDAAEPCCDPDLGAAGQDVCDLDCNGIIAPCSFGDLDADGFTPSQGDCDDTDPLTYPGAFEKCGDGIDQDCIAGDLACNTVSDNDFDGFHSGIDCNDTNNQVNPWAKEVCNFIDDDCDGLIDEGNPTGQIGSCGPSVPECPPGEWVCVHDPKTYTVQVLCVIEDHFQADEICNDLDDDCDGEVDETYFELGMPCDGPDSDQCPNGAYECSEDGSDVTCGVESSVDLAESCDTIDNDCDGETDEHLTYKGIDLAEVCDGEGECGTGVVICNFFNTTTCSTNPDGPFSQAKPEACNGADDDCDGAIDETFFYKGAPIGAACDGVGECGAGIVECASASAVTCSSNPNGSAPQTSVEICDGLDNNCDAHVDEGIPPEAGPCKMGGVCGGGGVVAQCKLAAWVCDYSAVFNYEDPEVSCDGFDNDCDGHTDGEFLVGTPCDSDDSDLCPTGTWTCAPDGSGANCINETNKNIAEVCNGLDDDCDGLTDEVQADPGAAGCLTEGVCEQTAAVLVFCGVDGLVCNYDDIAGYQEEETSCDGLDNDCDGQTDEEMAYVGQPLGAPCEGTGACGQGLVECSLLKQIPICSTEQGGSASQSVLEACDGLDNDCDGQTDEDFVLFGVPVGDECVGSGGCGDAVGAVECDPDTGATLCSTSPGGSQDQSSSETCDLLDNDCDGLTDEPDDLDPALSPCPLVGVCVDSAAVVSCDAGEWACHHEELPDYAAIESACDDLDNNCNGVTDEGYPLKGQPCDGPDADQCATGFWHCASNGSGIVCDNETQPDQVEVCDGEDNDCDGFDDNGISWKGMPLSQPCDGEGECGVGLVQCAGDGTATCSTNPNGSNPGVNPEVCDNKDNDCDGVTDDGLTWNGIAVGLPCDGVGACGVGTVVCSPVDGDPTCSTNPDGNNPQGQNEICDGKDNDCDGQTDEEYTDLGQPCDGPDADLCKTGTKACISGDEVCQNDVACLPGSQCQAALPPQTDTCLCWQTPCDSGTGDACLPPSGGSTFGTCTCAGGDACQAPLTCVKGEGCQ